MLGLHISIMAAISENSERNICERFGLSSLKEVQKRTIEALLRCEDVFLACKTGSGKS